MREQFKPGVIYKNAQILERAVLVELEPFKPNEAMVFSPELPMEAVRFLVAKKQRQVVNASVKQFQQGGKVFPLEPPVTPKEEKP
jgi:hypothetical protein